MSQVRCRLVSNGAILESLVSTSISKADIPCTVVHLSDELRKVFEHDAKAALDPNVNKEELAALTACQQCVVLKSTVGIPVCIDGEEFESALSRKTGEPQGNAADFVVFEAREDKRLIAYMAEVKLGEKQKAKPNFPKCRELQEKFDTLALRLKDYALIGEQVFFIVPKGSFEGQRHRTHHWNEANSFYPRKLNCLCARAFLDRFSVPCVKTPSCEVPLSDLR